MTRVLVLMSTWNGERFLREQVDSILAQRVEGRVDLLVRDDGSSDRTLSILDAYPRERVTVIRGENVGAKASFLELVRLARDADAEHFALADQDDVWLPGKIARAVSRIPGAGLPALYCSALRLVDEQLRPIRTYLHPGNRTLGATLLVNCATGCTCVLNRPLLEAVRPPRDLADVHMHDWWIAAIASAIGSVHYDAESFIDYRQHAGSQVGIPSGVLALAARARKLILAPGRPTRTTQARALLDAIGDALPAASRETIRTFLECAGSVAGRLRYLRRIPTGLGAASRLRFLIRV